MPHPVLRPMLRRAQEQSKQEDISFEGFLVLGDFMLAGQRIRLYAADDETTYQVLQGQGRDLRTQTFTDIDKATEVFVEGVRKIIYYTSRSDVSLYSQQKARYARGSKQKFAKNNPR